MSNADDIKKLRETTGAGVMECKKALEDAQGNFEEAVKNVSARGLLRSETRAGKETGAGHIESYIHLGRIGVLLEVRAETDFVIRSAPFQELARELTLQIAATSPHNTEELLAQPYIKDESVSVAYVIKQVIAKVGENIKVEKFYRIEV